MDMKRPYTSWIVSVLAGIVVGSLGAFLALQAVGGTPQEPVPRELRDSTATTEPGGTEAVREASLRTSESELQTGANEPVHQPTETGEDITVSRRTAIVAATERVRNAVVTVYVVERLQRQSIGWFGDLLSPRQYEREGLGSGVVVSDDGYILTNDHVVGRADQITVQMADGRKFEGVVVDTEPARDLAVLKIDAPADLPVAELGDSSDILIGEWVIALGSPYGFNDPQPSVSVGVVSAVGRSFVTTSAGETRFFPSTIQTDAAVNPGNSGGPLVNALGEVIGINSFIVSQSGGSDGVGFAIPVNQVKAALQQIREYGHIRRAWTGFDSRTNTTTDVLRYRVAEYPGALVFDVSEQSPGEAAGLGPGCVIVEISGQRISNQQDLEEILVQAKIGDSLEIVYYSYPDRQREEARLTLEEDPRRDR
jgi:serine protease Do